MANWSFAKFLVSRARSECKLGSSDPAWCLDDQLFEKMGAIMSENRGKLLGLYDELPILSQINVFSSRRVTNSHEVAMFFQPYGASGYAGRVSSYLLLFIALVVLLVYRTTQSGTSG